MRISERHGGSVPSQDYPAISADPAEFNKAYLYWLHNGTCTGLYTSGYIGISRYPNQRLHQNKRWGVVPHDAKLLVLFEADRQTCLTLERHYRPLPNTGWNKAPGGERGGWHNHQWKTRPRKISADGKRIDLHCSRCGEALIGRTCPGYCSRRCQSRAYRSGVRLRRRAAR